MASQEFAEDQMNALWKLYKKNQKAGMMWMRAFNIDVLFVGDFETLKHLFNHPDFQDRFDSASNLIKCSTEDRQQDTKIFGNGIHGVLLSKGKTWSDQRRFTLRTLRDFGFGKTGMEEMIKEELILFSDLLHQAQDQPFDFLNKFNLPVLNALWKVTVGQRFSYDDPKLISVIERLTQLFKRAGEPKYTMPLVFPWVTKMFPKFMERDQSIKVNHDIMNMMRESVDEHEETLDPNEPRDFTDKVLMEISKTTDPSSSYYGVHGKENLVNTLFDMFLAGSETTSTTLTWAMLYMARYPRVQKKVAEEMEAVIGRNSLPSLSHRGKLIYAEAVLTEIQRYANIIPNGVQHVCNYDFTINGFTIPANTMVQPVMCEILKVG